MHLAVDGHNLGSSRGVGLSGEETASNAALAINESVKGAKQGDELRIMFLDVRRTKMINEIPKLNLINVEVSQWSRVELH